MKFFLVILAFFFTVSQTHAFDLPKSYVCYRASSPIAIDGNLNDPAWANASWTDPFVDIEGDKKPAPRFRTRVKMLWDDQCFYVAADLQEPHVWATITKRDDVIFHDNDFEIFMDPNGDNYSYGELEISALNTQWDLFLPKPYKDSGHADDSWDIVGLQTAVAVQGTLNNPADVDSGWTVEISMPWKSLQRLSYYGTAPRESDQWHINFSRVEWLTQIENGHYRKVAGKPEDNWVWSPQGVIDMHRPEMWGIVQFSLQTYGPIAVRPDPFAEHHRALHLIYYAEKEYYEKHGVWCGNVDDLHLVLPPFLYHVDLGSTGYFAYIVTNRGRPSINQFALYCVYPKPW